MTSLAGMTSIPAPTCSRDRNSPCMSGVADTLYQTPYGSFALRRYPVRRTETLRAWCGADTLLLEEAHRRAVAPAQTLVVNDTHGALCIALQPRALWTDSALSAAALQHNTATNGRNPTPLISSTQIPPTGDRLVLLRIPKTLPYFEYQLACLASVLPAGATLLAAGMDKHLSPRTADILERFFGPTERHPGRRKARLFSATRSEQPAPSIEMTVSYYCDALEADLQSLPNVFSRDKLDLGSRFLVAHLGQLAPASTAIDLACGNGVLGLAAFKQGLAKSLLFCDESAMAIASAQANVEQLHAEASAAFSFHQGDGLLAYEGAPVELILCNPPFHLEHTVDEFAGRHLLAQCAQHLSSGGRLCLVANRHLDYMPLLRHAFRRVEKLATNAKFNIFVAHKA